LQEIKKYYSTNAISQSSLKDLAYHPLYYKKKHIDKTISDEKADSDFFSIGRCTECLLLTPEHFDDMFAIIPEDLPEPTPHVKKLAKNVLDENIDIKNIDNLFSFAKSLKLFGQIKAKDSFEEKLKKENFEDFLNFYRKNADKTIINQSLYYKSRDICESFIVSPFTGPYFKSYSDVEVLISLPIYWIFSEEVCKSLIDFILIDHTLKTIHVNDLKTTADSTSDFSSSVLKYRYDIQGAYYLEAVKWWINNVRRDLVDYHIQHFRFFVESSTTIGSPLIYILTKGDIEVGKNGGKLRIGGYLKKVKGFSELFDDLKWHKETGIWHYTREQYENKGEIFINIDNCN